MQLDVLPLFAASGSAYLMAGILTAVASLLIVVLMLPTSRIEDEETHQ